MEALVFHGTQSLRVESVPEPTPGPNEVLVSVTACGICGSDVHGYLGHSARRSAHVPLVMGHEFTGRIVELGDDVDGLVAVGDRVVVQPQISCGQCRACRAGLSNICPNMAIIGIERPGAFAELVAVPANRVFPLPTDVSDLDGSLAETLAVEVHLFRAMTLPLLRTVVVLGAGAQGLFAVQLARLAGAGRVLVSDVMPERLALAEQMGANVTIQVDRQDVVQTVLSHTDGWGADLVIDAAGSPVTRQQGVAVLAPGGMLGLVGLGKGETLLDFLPLVGRELTIRGSYCYSDDDFQRALELIRSGQVSVRDMLVEVPLRDGVSYFERLVSNPTGLTKVVLRPD